MSAEVELISTMAEKKSWTRPPIQMEFQVPKSITFLLFNNVRLILLCSTAIFFLGKYRKDIAVLEIVPLVSFYKFQIKMLYLLTSLFVMYVIGRLVSLFNPFKGS